jgi:hypothetical protein
MASVSGCCGPTAVCDGEHDGSWAQAEPIKSGTFRSLHAGAMLTHASTSAIGAWQILAEVCVLADGAAGADLAILTATRVGFTLGALTIEATKHLSSTEAGPLIGLTRLPSLRAWRACLRAISDTADPLDLQRRLVKAMLAFAPAQREVPLAERLPRGIHRRQAGRVRPQPPPRQAHQRTRRHLHHRPGRACAGVRYRRSPPACQPPCPASSTS